MQKTRLINTAVVEKQCTEMEEVQLLKNVVVLAARKYMNENGKFKKKFYVRIVIIEESDLISIYYILHSK